MSIDTVYDCRGCGYKLWVRDPELPNISGTLPQVEPGGDCPYCGAAVDLDGPSGGGSVPQNDPSVGGFQ